jgi:hypothetical protein
LLGRGVDSDVKPGRVGWLVVGIAALGVIITGLAISAAARKGQEDFDFKNPPDGYEVGVRRANADHSIKVGNLDFKLAGMKKIDGGIFEVSLGLESGFEIVGYRIFDSSTREMRNSGISLQRIAETDRVRIVESGGRLPEEIDLWLRITETRNADRIVIPAREGAEVSVGEATIVLRDFLAGSMNGIQVDGEFQWDRSSRRNEEAETTLSFINEGAPLVGKYVLVAVRKDGSRVHESSQHFRDFSRIGDGDFCSIEVPQNEIAHFEMVPFADRHKFFFEAVKVPGRGFPPALTNAQKREARRLIAKIPAGDEATLDSLVGLGPGVATEMIPLLQSGKSDRAAIKVLERLAPDPAVQNLLVETIRDKPGNARHCALIAIAKSGNPDHAEFVGQFLDTSSIAAIVTLSQLGGQDALQQLLDGFDAVSTEKWFLLAQHIGDFGDPRAIPELKRRLGEVELPANDRFPPATVWAFGRALAALEPDEETAIGNHNFSQGQHFRYPYDGQGLPNTFSVTQPRDYYVGLPDVDPETAAGRAAIFAKLEESTDGPGFTMDGDRLILFNGLVGMPLWPDGRPFPASLGQYFDRTPHRDILARIRETKNEQGPTPGSKSMLIPADGLVAAATPDNQLVLLTLRKKSENFSYQVGMRLFNPHLLLVKSGNTEKSDVEFGQRWSLLLSDYRNQIKDSAWRLDIGQMTVLTPELFKDPKGIPMIGLRLDGKNWSLVAPGAEQFLMTEAEGVWDDPKQAAAALRQGLLGSAPLAPDQTVKAEAGARVNGFSSQERDRVFAFAIKMKTGAAVAGVIKTHRFDFEADPEPEVRFLYKFLSNPTAKAIFSVNPEANKED